LPGYWRSHPRIILLIGLLIVCLLVVVAAMLVFRQEAGMLRTILFQPRSGCTFAEALEGGRSALYLGKRSTALLQASRIIERDAAGYVLWHTPRGDFWAPEKDDSWFYVLAELELHPYGEGGSDSLRGGVVLDCGAHLGTYTRQALAAGAGLVVAIEPGPQQVYCLRRTFAREIAAGRVRIEPRGVWNEEGELTLHTSPATELDSFTGPDTGSSEKISVTTVDHLVSGLHLSSVDLIKMDIENAEPQALSGASQTLKKYKPRLEIASYHTFDEYRRISETVLKANPSYRSTNVGCRVDLGYSVPLTLMFY
jgi:FkbM family methyltransferase